MARPHTHQNIAIFRWRDAGGGFALPPLQGHARFWKQTVEQLEKQGKNLTIAVVEYSQTHVLQTKILRVPS